jgi:uncharacterized protein (DUF1800 family)
MLSDFQKIKHLYNRAAFGPAVNDFNRFHNIRDAAAEIFRPVASFQSIATITLEEVQQARQKLRSGTAGNIRDLKQMLRQHVFSLNQQWLEQMTRSEAQLQEKMALFWHGHFACRSTNPYFDQQYLDIIRKNALGNFGTLLKEVSKTPAMLQFLNNQQNKKGHPNENFAREVMELFTLGRGNYSEQDIREAARAFTGYGFDLNGAFRFRMQLHDSGSKTFLGKHGNFSGDDILQIILGKKACAYYVAAKVYRFFVDEKLNGERIQSLADTLYDSGYEITALLKELFTADWFYDETLIGNRIKSPVELLAGMFRMVPVAFESEQASVFIQRSLGQVLLNPPNVAGWPGGRAWIDSSSLLFRMRLPQVLYYDKTLDFSPKDEFDENMSYLQMADAFILKTVSNKLQGTADWKDMLGYFSSRDDVTAAAASMLLAKQPDAAALKCIRFNGDLSSKEAAIKSTVIDIFSLPDYQLS